MCGKGPAAAAVTSLVRYTLRAAAIHDPDPVTVVSTLNTALHESYSGDDPRYCTLIFGVLTPRAAGDGFTVTLAGGGHPSALHLRADGTAAYLPTPGGLLVGVVPNARFTTATAVLAPGDTLLLYTDGLTEARTAGAEARYGDDALHVFATGLAPAGAEAVVTAVRELLDSFGDGLDDDTAVLALGVPAGPTGETA